MLLGELGGGGTKSLDRKSWTSGTVLGPPMLRRTIAVPLGVELGEGVVVARVRVAAKLEGIRWEKKVLGKAAVWESCFKGIREDILRCN